MRENQIKNNPTLDGLEFRHCCVQDPFRYGGKTQELHSKMRASLEMYSHYRSRLEEEITELLENIVSEEVTRQMAEEIISFNPDLIIIH